MTEEKLKEKFYNELDADLYEADGADYVAEKCVEIALSYTEERVKELESKLSVAVKALKCVVNYSNDLNVVIEAKKALSQINTFSLNQHKGITHETN